MAKAKGRRPAKKKVKKPAPAVPATGCVGSLDVLAGWVGCNIRTLKSWKLKHESFPIEPNGTYRVCDVIEWRLNGFSSSKPDTPEKRDDIESRKQRLENAELVETEARAIKSLIAARKEARSMIPFEPAKQFYSEAFAKIRQPIEAFPDEISQEIPEEFRHQLTERIRNKLRLILKRFSKVDIADMEID